MVSEKICFNIWIGIQYEMSTLGLINSRGLIRIKNILCVQCIMTLASTVFKNSTFHNFSNLNALGSKFDNLTLSRSTSTQDYHLNKRSSPHILNAT